jgi:hypothetical protein
MESVGGIAAMEDAGCCQDSAAALASLCHEHCKDSKVALPDAVSPVADFVPAFIATVPLPALSAQLHGYASAAHFHAPSPPIFILNRCFRI